ncbi:ArsR/SmtB family transcription factor [Pinisolibacter aquiterrae]|uniref:ArsR/SmtB family transcription factor n=1 Tax=Pinisolibacter aquiterrae TaxID=2815579 RepID=UPI001C3C8E4A|nr:metalloregulator ArsR/SmtB family transcription factor [Pinisolibacter aquiterrae]MBV5265475.1 metalloregulator ArsR/SmtB family transcription factor [Pinisolibacter aquiterrae]MCC8236958.1 metalloregulator ArsR/SmtB family transcription factor [Pinisolibacter aquiterrae]
MSPTDLMSVLSDPTRLEALRLLWDGQEHCVCELMGKLGASQSRMSRHMSALKTAGLVGDRRDAQWVRYRRKPRLDPLIVAVVDAVLALPVAAVEDEEEAA